MDLAEIIDAELGALRKRLNRDALTVLETGTIRSDEESYRLDDGWSTLTFAEQARDHGGVVYSIDLDTSVAADMIGARGLRSYVRLVQGYSIGVLAEMLTERNLLHVDVLFLDSDNDAGLILHEWMLGSRLLSRPGLLMVDDVDLASTEVVKGHRIAPWLVAHGHYYRIVQRDGKQITTGVLVAEIGDGS